MSFKNKILKNFFFNIILVLLGAFLFALSQPGFLFTNGLSLLAWFAYIPVFLLIRRSSFKIVWLFGFIYGFISYALFASWLVIFSFFGSIAILLEYGVLLTATFLIMKLSDKLFKKHGWLVMWVVWCAYEYLKTKGYGGFNYGVTAYSQWRSSLFIQVADIAGVWGLSALISFPSAYIANILFEIKKSDKKFNITEIRKNIIGHKACTCIWVALFAFTVVYGCLKPKNYSNYKKVKIAAMQQNTDPWHGGFPTYNKDVHNLINLTKEALSKDPDIDFVLWPETAVVPPLLYNYKRRTDRKRFNLIKELLEYINSTKSVFVFGNDHAVDRGGKYTEDYNTTLVFTPGKNVLPPDPEIYKKNHLVPFTEYFPFQKLFPKLYKALLEGDTHFWTPGNELTVFHENELNFSTPICFEDSFGSLCQGMYKNGARAFLNVSNDAWSKSLSCQNQHLSMAVFRSVENRVPSVRATASGQTCIIDPNGHVQKEATPFKITYITGEIPVIPLTEKSSLYSLFGDYFGIMTAILAGALLLLGIVIQLAKLIEKQW